MGSWIDGSVRNGAASAGYVPVFVADFGRRSRRRPRRFRGDPRQRDPLHHRLRRVPSQRCRHCRTYFIPIITTIFLAIF